MQDAGYAALQIIPSFEGFKGKLEQGSATALVTAGRKGGEDFGDAAAKEGGERFSSKIGSSIKTKAFAGIGLLAGATVAGAFGQALENGALEDKLAAQLGASPKEAAKYGQAAGDLYNNAFGDSLADVNDSIRSVVTNIDGMRTASKSKLEDITATVLNLNAAFDEEPAAITRAAAQMERTGLAKSAKDALDIITVGFQSGADKAQDLLDTYNEYGTQFRKLGIDGAQATGLIAQGLKGGARDADLVADTFKEFSIRAIDGSKTTRMAFEDLGLPIAKMEEDLAKGGKKASDATQLVLDHLRSVKDPARRAQIAVSLFGTQSEDMGQALYDLDLPKAAKQFGDVAGAADRMGDTLSDNASSKITSFTRKLRSGVVDFIGDEVIPVIENFADGPDGKKLGKAFSDAADDIGPLANKLLPAVASALGTTADALGKAAPLASDLVDAFNGMPKWAQQGLVLGGVGAIAGKKLGVGSLLGGGPGGGGGMLGGVASKASPVPVFVTNQGFGGPGVVGGGKTGGGLGGKLAPIAGAALPALGFGLVNSDPSAVHPGVNPKPGTVGSQADFEKLIADQDKAKASFQDWFDTVTSGNHKMTESTKDLIEGTGQLGVAEGKLPEKLVTKFLAPGVIENRQDANRLAKQYDLTPKQKQTLFKTLGIPQAKKETSGVIDLYGRASKTYTGAVRADTGQAEASLNRVLALMNAISHRGALQASGVLPGGRERSVAPRRSSRRTKAQSVNLYVGDREMSGYMDERIGSDRDLEDERRRAGAR